MTLMAGIEKESQADWKEANLGRANPGMTYAVGMMCFQPVRPNISMILRVIPCKQDNFGWDMA